MSTTDGLPYIIETAFHGAFLDPLEGVGRLDRLRGVVDVEDPEGAGMASILDLDWIEMMRRLECEEGWELASEDGDYWRDGTPVTPLMLAENTWALQVAGL